MPSADIFSILGFPSLKVFPLILDEKSPQYLLFSFHKILVLRQMLWFLLTENGFEVYSSLINILHNILRILADFQNAGIIFEKRPKIPKSIVGSIYDLHLVINPFGVAVCTPVLKIV